MPALTLSGRVALVIGGSGSLGCAISRQLGHSGMTVVVAGRNATSCRRLADEINGSGGIAYPVVCDVKDTGSIGEAVTETAGLCGCIDVLVNNAGILDQLSIEETTQESWDEVQRVNCSGVFFSVQKCLPFLKKSKHPRIINIASNAGRMGGYENGLAYTASKGAVIALTYGLARRLAPFGITVNCIAPGTIESDMSRARSAEALKGLLSRFPLGRLGRPEEVAAAVCYFASEESSFTTGSVLDVNGGLFMG